MPSATLYTGQREIRSSTIDRIQLPKVIPCAVCKKNKPQEQFSKKQIGELKGKVSRFGRATITPSNSIRCFQCTGTQNTEMHCILCDETKVLKKFALAQRRNPDAAKCIECMAAQEMVLPDGYDEHGYEEGGDEEDDDVETGSRRRDPWEKDQFTGQFLLDKNKGPSFPHYTNGASGSSRALSGYDTSSNSISGYSKVDFKETRGGKVYASSTTSDATSATGGVKIAATPRTKTANDAKMLTPINLATIEKDSHVNLFGRLHLSEIAPDAEGGSDEGSDDDFDRRTTTTATGEAPKKPQSVIGRGAYQQDHYNSDEEEELRPQRLPVERAGNKYTAWDQHGNPHEIADTVSTVPSNYAPSSTDGASTTKWSTVSRTKKISHSGFDHRKDNINLPNNPRKFARVRPQNLDSERVNENLLVRTLNNDKKQVRRTLIAHMEEDDEDY